MSKFENRRWLVLPVEKIEDINFNQVKEYNADSLRKSIDGTKTFVKYDIVDIKEDIVEKYVDPETDTEKTNTTKAGVYGRPDVYSTDYTEYTHEEILTLLNTEEWVEQQEEE